LVRRYPIRKRSEREGIIRKHVALVRLKKQNLVLGVLLKKTMTRDVRDRERSKAKGIEIEGKSRNEVDDREITWT